MSVPATVLINAAGRGTRLGIGLNKALLPIQNRTLIELQLQLLPSTVPVVIGVGYQARRVSELARRIRPDARISFNADFESSGTGATLCRSAKDVSGRVVSLDADLLVHPEDMYRFLFSEIDLVGTCLPQSVDPVYVEIEEINGISFVQKFSRTKDELRNQREWTGLLNCQSDDLVGLERNGHVFEILEERLPISEILIRSKELDFKEELPEFESWAQRLIGGFL